MKDVRQGGDESGGGTLTVVEQLSTLDMAVPMSQAHLGIGPMKGTLASAQILTSDSAIPSLPSNVFEHKDLCGASHFLLALSSCSFHHWQATCFQTGIADDDGGGEVEGCGVQTVGGYTARFRCGEGRLGFGKVAGRGCDESIKNFDMSGQVGGDRDRGGTHQSVEKTSKAAEPAFIFLSLLIFLDSLRSVHVRVIHPLVIAVRVSLPPDQVLALPSSSIVVCYVSTNVCLT